MPKFEVQIGRDARVYHKAVIEADSLEDAKSKLTSDGYHAKDAKWELDGHDSFDAIETCCISTDDKSDDEDEDILAFFTSSDGWGDNNAGE